MKAASRAGKAHSCKASEQSEQGESYNRKDSFLSLIESLVWLAIKGYP